MLILYRIVYVNYTSNCIQYNCLPYIFILCVSWGEWFDVVQTWRQKEKKTNRPLTWQGARAHRQPCLTPMSTWPELPYSQQEPTRAARTSCFLAHLLKWPVTTPSRGWGWTAVVFGPPGQTWSVTVLYVSLTDGHLQRNEEAGSRSRRARWPIRGDPLQLNIVDKLLADLSDLS